MSHRIRRFAAFAIFARFYLVAAVDSILGFYRHQTDTKTSTATTRTSLSEVTVLVSTFPPVIEQKFRSVFDSSMQQGPWASYASNVSPFIFAYPSVRVRRRSVVIAAHHAPRFFAARTP